MSRWTFDDVKHLIKKPTHEKKKRRSRAEVFTPTAERLLCGDDLERQTQSAIIDFLSALNLLFYHVNNGADIGGVAGAIAQGQGVVAGVPDLCVCEPFDFNGVAYHGLYIEVKKPKGGALGEHQKLWAAALRERGYWVISGIGGASLVIDFLVMVYKPRAKKLACMGGK